MASKGYTSARALLVMVGLALVAGCGTRSPAAAPSAGELMIEWQPGGHGDQGEPEVQIEVRSVVGDEPIRRRIELRAPGELQTRLALPPGVYDVRLSSAVLRPASGADVAADSRLSHVRSLQLPPPQIVLVRAAGTTRARVALAEAATDSWELSMAGAREDG
jgi:hypothetical protein